MNRAEELVYWICRKSFLSMWSFATPKGKKGKELCDILVVYEPDIMIFSVKDIKLSDTSDVSVDWERWQKRAIEDSCRQIYGAERWLETSTHVVRLDGTTGLSLPQKAERRVHRISVSLGGNRQVPIYARNIGKGYVHVFDEISFAIVLQELDTITDFVTYLSDKEKLAGVGIVLDGGGEEDLLAYYMIQGRSFPKDHKLIIVDDTLWNGFVNDYQYQARKFADRESYIWDELIEVVAKDALEGYLEPGPSLSEVELALRIMAREDRFQRRILGKAFRQFLDQKLSRARIVPSSSGIVYVYLSTFDVDSKYVVAELAARCFIARGLNPNSQIVIGIAYMQSRSRQGFALRLLYLNMNKGAWTQDDQAQFEFLQRELGYFSNPAQTFIDEDEFPKS